MAKDSYAEEGLQTQKALERLCSVIDEEVSGREFKLQREGTLFSRVGQRLSLKPQHDIVFPWCTALIISLLSLALYVSAIATDDKVVLVDATILLLFSFLNLYLSGWNHFLKHRELIYHSKQVLHRLQGIAAQGKIWKTDDYLPLFSPPTNSISIQWTYRDGQLVNLPQVLLVEGDIILLRPGSSAPAKCCHFEREDDEMVAGEIYRPETPEPSAEATLRPPLQNACFRLLETPYRHRLRSCLENSVKRPISLLENRRLLADRIIQHVVMPVVLCLSLLVNVIRYILIQDDVGQWAEMLLILPVNAVIPLLPLAFPSMWILMNHYGSCRIVALFHKSRSPRSGESLESINYSEDEERQLAVEGPVVTCKGTLEHFWSSVSGKSCYLPRTANLLHGLGTVTSFCCINKRGILSYADPTIEKVFFMSSKQGEKQEIFTSENSLLSEESQQKKSAQNSSTDILIHDDILPQSHPEVLSLSMNSSSHFGLEFDQNDWENHINSLKPMGLNVLLNACNPETCETYSNFLSHVYASTTEGHHKQPVHFAHRRCMCQLPYLIGFSENAGETYEVEQQIAMYKSVTLHERKGNSNAPHDNHSFIQRKSAAPHVMSVLVKDSASGAYQVMTQGSSSMVLGLCTDFWDGNDLCDLEDAERKKITDFYQRAVVSSYCTTLAYQPVVDVLPYHAADAFIELPSNFGRHGHGTPQNSPPSLARSSWDVEGMPYNLTRDCPKPRKCHSLDSAIDSLGMLSEGEDCYRALKNQIFLGMVTYNFQPKSDIVALIEHLDQACIRFVHFSEDQVLRSKVFSEKMGLEAGWNCHISLQSNAEVHMVHSTDSNGSKLHSSQSQQSSMADVAQIDMDVEAQHVHFLQDSLGNVQAKVEEISITNDNLIITEEAGTNKTESKKSEKESEKCCTEEIFDENTDLIKQGDMIVKQGEHAVSNFDRLCSEREGQMSVGSKPRLSQIHSGQWQEAEPLLSQSSSVNELSKETGNKDRHRQISETHTCSDGTDVDTTDSVTGVWDISNRAKLPRGIENIRPHIATVDNVPLQVPLFTDTTPETTQEMIKIMQENGEVVCCMGSSVNLNNMPIFSQADFSIGLEPLYPHICSTGVKKLENHLSGYHTFPQPLEVTTLLTSLPCSLYFHRNDYISVASIIQEARCLCNGITNCFTFFMFTLLAISAINFFSSLLFLAPPLSGRHILWLSTVITPLLSMSLFGSPSEAKVMRMSTGKNSMQTDLQTLSMMSFCFLTKFGGMVVVCITCHFLSMQKLCEVASGSMNETTCHLILGSRNLDKPWNGLGGELSKNLILAQNLQMFLITLYFIVISASFVHSLKSLWKRSPFTNGLWCAISIFILLFAAVNFTILNLYHRAESAVKVKHIPLSVWMLGFLWPIPNLAVCEAVKLLEIRDFVRWQKRSKLQFDTKLGMNSPF